MSREEIDPELIAAIEDCQPPRLWTFTQYTCDGKSVGECGTITTPEGLLEDRFEEFSHDVDTGEKKLLDSCDLNPVLQTLQAGAKESDSLRFLKHLDKLSRWQRVTLAAALGVAVVSAVLAQPFVDDNTPRQIRQTDRTTLDDFGAVEVSEEVFPAPEVLPSDTAKGENTADTPSTTASMKSADVQLVGSALSSSKSDMAKWYEQLDQSYREDKEAAVAEERQKREAAEAELAAEQQRVAEAAEAERQREESAEAERQRIAEVERQRKANKLEWCQQLAGIAKEEGTGEDVVIDIGNIPGKEYGLSEQERESNYYSFVEVSESYGTKDAHCQDVMEGAEFGLIDRYADQQTPSWWNPTS